MNVDELEKLLKLMVSYNVDHLEVADVKINMKNATTAPKANAPAIVESKLKMPPTDDELALWSTMAPNPNTAAIEMMTARTAKKANKGD